MQGNVGIVGRSGTLGYEAADQLKRLGLGISTSVGIGGDPINGSSHRDILEHFENDPETKVVIMIGEIGGPQEVEAGQWAKDNMSKPVVAYIAGLTAPEGRRMGHAGAIISSAGESAAEKVAMLKELGVIISPTPSAMVGRRGGSRRFSPAPWWTRWSRLRCRWCCSARATIWVVVRGPCLLHECSTLLHNVGVMRHST
jgi:succinyl-CoA synthetase alpha subunit